MEIKLASHEHSMDYHNFHETDDKWCGKCSQKIFGAAFACLKCERWLHQSCAEALQHLPREITHPLHPQHHLILDWSSTWGITCNKCLKTSKGTNYGCCRCEFELDLACAFSSTDDHQSTKKKKERSNSDVVDVNKPIIQHYCHIDPMVLYKYGNNENHEYNYDYDCSWCDKPLAGNFYGCKGCKFFLHEICTNKIPKTLNHPFHPSHPLRMQFGGSQTNCNACTQIIEHRTGSTSSYCCQICNFNLDFECAKMLPTFKHECHSHYLTYFGLNYFLNNFKDKSLLRFHLECNACHELCSYSLYRCVQCDFNLHLQCVPVPPSAKHKYHRHPLVLTRSVREDVGEYYCDICEEERNPTQEVFCCERCKFIAHIECVINEGETSRERGSSSSPQSMEGKALVPEEMEQIEMMDENNDSRQLLFRPRIHRHPLKFYEEIESFEQPYCRACRLEVNGPCYICDVCKPSVIHGIYLHENCARLPNDMHHPLHPRHRLNLYATPPYMLDFIICDACEEVSFGFFYFCEECDFKVDLKCATGSQASKLDSDDQRESELFHFSDKHKLIFCNFGDPTYERHCNFCRLPILGPTYICLRCGWILHESCVRLPQEMQVPIHPQHVSILSYFRGGRCHACGLKLLSAGYNYGCQECDLNFHITCANSLGRALKPDKSHSHVHDLYYFGADFLCFFAMYTDFIDIFAGLSCSYCGQNCSGQPFYRCLECRINFHLECVPIPRVVKSKSHIHPFTLKDSFVEDDSENGCYCDVCEEERRPNDHVYFCEECQGLFVAHIECALIKEEQVLSYLVPRERRARLRRPHMNRRS